MSKAYVKTRQFPKKEGAFVLEFMDEIKKITQGEVWFFKSHGEPMQVRGIPDILMCYTGLFVGLEFKIMRHGKIEPTPYQEYNLDLINKSQGFGMIVWFDEDTAECGINTKRIGDKKVCAQYLIDLLENFTAYPPNTFKELRNKG